MSEKKERFGRYLILDHLVDGGMAKICRARFLGEQADKVVAIKMIQPQYSSDESFKQMFMDEIKVTFGLLHPNIVQTYDYGIHKDQLFVAMEYCDGRNLKEYLDRLRQKKFVFPVEISIYIISQVCQGLHYSHTFTDKLTGKAAHIIHRDISPHNIMLTYDGAVKIIDFGIAKANTNSEATQAGTIKGKLSYLAPEYLDGLALDARYDMFAVGITLWEMLCSRKLFKAANDLAVLKKIQECKIVPPSKINPNVPKELDDIVLQALKKDRNKRFENMDQFNRALIKFLYANYPDFNSSDLSYFAKELFKEEIKKDREKLFEFGKIDIKSYLADWKREQEGGTNAAENEERAAAEGKDLTSTGTNTRKKEQVLDFGFASDETATKTSLKKSRAAARSARTATKASGKVEVIDGDKLKMNMPNAKKVAFSAPPSESGKTRTRTKSRTKSRGNSRENNTSTGTVSFKVSGGKPMSLSKVVAFLVIVAGGAYFGNANLPMIKDLFTNRTPASEKPRVEPTVVENDDLNQGINAIQENLKNGIRITNYDRQLHTVYVDGEKVRPDFLNKIKVPSGKEIFLRIERPGFRHFVKKLNLNGRDLVEVTIPSLPQQSFGYIYVAQGCRMFGNLTFELYGEKRSERLPLTRYKLGIPFPIDGDGGRHPANSDGRPIYTVYYQMKDKPIKRKLEFSFDSDEQRVDLCSL